MFIVKVKEIVSFFMYERDNKSSKIRKQRSGKFSKLKFVFFKGVIFFEILSTFLIFT